MDNQKILRILRYILAGMTFISLFLVLLRPIGDFDFFWHLATGRWIVEHLTLPTNDPFNYTTPSLLSSREHFILTSYWLSQILYYGIYYVSNWNGFILLRFIILSIIIYFIYKRARGSDKTIFLCVMAVASIAFAQLFNLERPHSFSFIFFAILLYLLEKQVKAKAEVKAEKQAKVKAEVKKKNLNLNLNLFLLPLLMLLWANMHGGYILGQVVILVYLLSEGLKFLHPSLRPMERSSYKRFLITGISGILSALINPNTYEAITETWNISQRIASVIILEHQSTIAVFKIFYRLDIPVYWLLLFISAACLLYMVIRKRFEIKDIIMLIGLGYFSFTQLRYIAFFLIWAIPFISLSLTTLTYPSSIPDLAPWPRSPAMLRLAGLAAKQGRRPSGACEGDGRGWGDRISIDLKRPLLGYICVMLSLFIIAALIIRPREFDKVKNIIAFKSGQWVDDYYPEDAVNFIIKNDIKGNMFNYFAWGGYLIWRFYPEKKVFVDSRSLYIPQYYQYIDILNATLEPEVKGMPYYKAILESYRVRYMVIPLFSLTGEMPRIVGEMIKDREWIPVFFGVNTMIFVKDTSENYDVVHIYSVSKDTFVNYLLNMLDNLIKELPGDSRFYLAKGDLYFSQRRFKEAREEYVKVLKINPFNPTAKERLNLINKDR